jgi:hypothetical protein
LDTCPKIAEWQSLLENRNRITTIIDKNLIKGQGYESRINISMKNAHSLYKLSRRNVVSTLKVVVQNT